jgi:hypothetical protein
VNSPETEAQAKAPALTAIKGATLSCPDLEHARSAYVATLGYREIGCGTLHDGLATRWGTPRHAGARTLLLRPPTGEGPFLRFIETPDTPPYRACSAWGWHALELAVTNCDAATDRLLRGPFTLLDAPHELGFSAGALRASQLLGPFGEVLYLTEIRKPVPGYRLPTARSLVDRLFIVVQHGPSATTGLAQYADRFGNHASPVMNVDIAFMARLHGCPPEHRYGIGTLALAHDGYFELDDTPSHIGPRPVASGTLPAGISIVSCSGALEAGEAPPPDDVYAGVRRMALTTGPAGEWLEILD